MSEAQRLKMTGGHFIWIWADTSSTAEFFQPNSVPNVDDKDQLMNVKNNYEALIGRKSKYDKMEAPSERQYYQQQAGNKRLQQNSTRYKSPGSNSNRFHHIIGLRKPGDELNGDGGIPSIFPERGFLKSDKLHDSPVGQMPMKAKRASQKSEKTNSEHLDSDSSTESGRVASNLNIKNINSHEFNANYYDPYSPSRLSENDNDENIFGPDIDDATNGGSDYYDYDKINPFQPRTDASFAEPTRRPVTDTSTTKAPEKLKANNDKSSNNSNRNNRNNKAPSDPITAAPYSKLFIDNDDLDLENYSEASNDLKAKRADNFPSTFNISSHVFFHHFKDFPVGLLALRHIKMNVDRVFVRSAIRLFASTWSRVEQDEELKVASGGKLGGRKNDWQDNGSDDDYDYEEVNTYKADRKQKNKAHVNVNSRHNNARGSRKYKRDVNDAAEAATLTSIPNLVNSSNNKTSNSNSKLINNLTNKTYSQHVSDLNSHPSDDGNKSNNDNIKHNDITSNSNKTGSAVHLSDGREMVRELKVDGSIDVQKRQNSWWSSTFRGRTAEKGKVARGTPQYKGGCFGLPTRADMKRSELFAR